MYDSPSTLEELCLETICDNLETVFEMYFERKPQGVKKKFRFRDPDMFLFGEISERLLRKLGEKRMIGDSTLNLFSERNTRLRAVRIKSTRLVSAEGLAVLRQHKIVDLECVDLKDVCITKILDCLGDWTIANIQSLNFSRCFFTDMSRYCFMVKLTNLKNLRSLNVAYTELNQPSLQMICEDLKFLEKLDISGTYVTDLSPLLRLSNQLVSLAITDLTRVTNVADTVVKLCSLRHLDVSLVNEKAEELDTKLVTELLERREDSESFLNDLVSLEISGWREFINSELLLDYLHRHPKLRYLGLVLNHAAFEPIFCDPQCKEYREDLIVAGVGTENQIKVTLKKHYERHVYVQKALYHLFQLTSTFQDARPDIFELVLPAMAAHPGKFGVQMAATACLYNLTRGELSKQIHPKALSKGVKLTLNAMENFPAEFQLQKNSLLTLCSDRILQDVTFERFRCAKLVLDSLCAFDEINMNRMAVAICSILAAKVSTAETSELGAQPNYMKKLLDMVQNRVDLKLSDITMKFTLSALWNLTDESSATCTVFLEQGGGVLFLNVLKTFRGDSAIETKVLGLLNNIAEVERLRHNLMFNSLIEELHLLLKSEHIDVSYFAAGIVAHLASDGSSCWTARSFSRNEMLEELGKAVSLWKVPESEMVAYRSFRPFFPLLRKDLDHQVQLWAVWAIHHVCTKNPKRYCMMLREEKGTELLNGLLEHESCHPEIRHISTQILQTLEGNII